ncbi:MAG: roadblock/LC7 domain-containing protein, partial [Planctomycetes bacterium]|nr:roadblock/LC7 domain-containing protein [Planctomycetota bacterium]
MSHRSSAVSDAALRQGRMVYYEEHMVQVDRVLAEFLRRSGARSAYLIDKDGHLITKAGEAGDFHPDTISALVAGAFAATKEMARLLGEREFSALFHQGERDNIQLSLVGDRAILTVLFDDSTTLGMVRLYSEELTQKLTDTMLKAMERNKEKPATVSQEYGKAAEALQQANRIRPDARATLTLGLIHERLDQVDLALDAYRAAAALEPDRRTAGLIRAHTRTLVQRRIEQDIAQALQAEAGLDP